jgi:ATP-dependent protease ClpP protease subunit
MMQKQQLLAFVAKAEGSTLELDVYESIGESFWGDSVSAKDVLAKIRDAKPETVNMRVNSGGGDPFDAIAISNLLKATGATVNVSIDGIAASAATHLWPVGSNVTMASNAMFMIHKAWTFALGNAEEMTKLADTLSKVDALQAGNYRSQAESRGSPVTAEQFSKLMAEETWMSAEEALAHGLIDTIGEAVNISASVNVSSFRRPPSALVSRMAAAQAFTVPKAAPITEEHMDPKTMQAAIEAKEAELATIKSERDVLKSANEKLTIEAEALKSQNAALVSERDAVSAKLQDIEAKAIESEVDALIPNVLDAAERDNFVALAKTSRSLFDSMVAQRKPRHLTSQIVTQELPVAVTTASIGADDQFNSLVEKDLT